MKTARKRLGDLGERLAAEYLEEMGHTIIARNWHGSHLEIDIISEDAEGIHFVEVKSRVAPSGTNLYENVDIRKQINMKKAALNYLNNVRSGDKEIFFDVVTVLFEGEKTKIDYIKQAFIPIYV